MFKPLLSPQDDPQKNPKFFDFLDYPLGGSPKFDGIRNVVKNSTAMSRTYKPLPSRQVQEEFALVNHIDCELIEGNPTDFGVYNRTQSHVMSEDKPGDLSCYIFDYTAPEIITKPYYERLEVLPSLILPPNHHIVEQEILYSHEDMLAYEEKQLLLGFEGIMLRDMNGRYKNGRATMREGIIFKLKRFQDSEGLVIGFVERNKNTNTKERDELGYAKRSSHKEGMVGAGTTGKFIVLWNGIELEVAPGAFTHEQLQEIWDNRVFYEGQYLKFRYFAHGVKDKPRYPRALGWRDLMDM